jgi:flagellar biosynthetic protein FliR
MLEQFGPENLFAYFLIFARVGSVIMVLPGFGETYITPRFRLLLALSISLVITPALMGILPGLPDSPLALFIMLVTEIGIGFYIGISARILISALQVAGMVAAYHSSLSNAFVFDPAAAQQGALAGAFLTLTALLLIFVTNLHHVMLAGIFGSYEVFAPGQMPPIGDISDAVARTVSQSFLLAMQISAPFIVVGLMFTLGVGLLNRLMPQVQMFFIAMPMQILLGMLILMLTLSSIMIWFLDAFEQSINRLFLGA